MFSFPCGVHQATGWFFLNYEGEKETPQKRQIKCFTRRQLIWSLDFNHPWKKRKSYFACQCNGPVVIIISLRELKEKLIWGKTFEDYFEGLVYRTH